MPKVSATLQNVPTKDPNWLRLRNVWERAARVINGGISFGTQGTIGSVAAGIPQTALDNTVSDNIAGVWALVTTTTSDMVIKHNLGRVPAGYIPMTKSAPVDIYTSPNNVLSNTQLILRASVAGVRVQLFIVG